MSGNKMATETTNVRQLVASLNKFVVSVYGRVAEEMQDQNILSSPISVFNALAVTFLGAREKSAEQLANIAGFGGVPYFHETLQEYLKQLRTPSTEPQTIRLSNYVLCGKGLHIQRDFRENCIKYYNTDILESDFSRPMDVCSLVNARVMKDTNNRIDELLLTEHIERNVGVLLLNAVYFKSIWLNKFDPKATDIRPFKVSRQATMDVEMMNLTSKFKFGVCQTMQCQGLELPYLNGTFSMIILLPLQEDGIRGLEKILSDVALDNLLQNMEFVETDVTIPRGHMGCQLELKPMLQHMGIEDLFDEHTADLSGLESTRSAFVSDVIQKSFIEVIEEGIETEVETVVMAGQLDRSRVERFNADHPFIFLIRENITNGILLIGRYLKPED